MKNKFSLNFKKVIFFIFIGFGIIFPLVSLSFTKKNSFINLLCTAMPLISFLCIFFLLKSEGKKAGKSLQQLFQEKVYRPETSALTLNKIIACSELSVLTTIYTDVVLLKKTKLKMAKSYSIYRYVGKIKTGIQLSECGFEFDPESQKIIVSLPPVKIFDHSIDIENIEKFDEKNSIFSKISNMELFDEITRKKQEALDRLIDNGLIQATENRVKMGITQILSAMGYMDWDMSIETKETKLLEHFN